MELLCTNDGKLRFFNFELKDELWFLDNTNLYKSGASVRTNWFKATVHFEINYSNLSKFIKEVDSILHLNGKKAAKFLDVSGNINFQIDMSAIGQIEITGTMTNSIHEEDSTIEFYLESEYNSLKIFYDQIIASFEIDGEIDGEIGVRGT